MCVWGCGGVCVHVLFLIFKFKIIRNHKTMIQITKNTGKSIKNHKKAAQLQYYIYMYKETKYSKMRLQYKSPFLKVKGQFTFSFSNRMFNFLLWFDKGFWTINMTGFFFSFLFFFCPGIYTCKMKYLVQRMIYVKNLLSIIPKTFSKLDNWLSNFSIQKKNITNFQPKKLYVN